MKDLAMYTVMSIKRHPQEITLFKSPLRLWM